MGDPHGHHRARNSSHVHHCRGCKCIFQLARLTARIPTCVRRIARSSHFAAIVRSLRVLLLGMLVLGTTLPNIHLISLSAWEGWLLLWILLSAAALTTWLFTALPPRFWFRWIAQSRLPLIAAGIAGLAAYALGNWALELWDGGTIAIVATRELLPCCDYFAALRSAWGVRSDEMVIGTSRFVVTIAPHCSGLEGIGLICAFTGIYLWTCRRELSFPLALLLFPAGMISIWLLNSVRIAMLISLAAGIKTLHSRGPFRGWLEYSSIWWRSDWSGPVRSGDCSSRIPRTIEPTIRQPNFSCP